MWTIPALSPRLLQRVCVIVGHVDYSSSVAKAATACMCYTWCCSRTWWINWTVICWLWWPSRWPKTSITETLSAWRTNHTLQRFLSIFLAMEQTNTGEWNEAFSIQVFLHQTFWCFTHNILAPGNFVKLKHLMKYNINNVLPLYTYILVIIHSAASFWNMKNMSDHFNRRSISKQGWLYSVLRPAKLSQFYKIHRPSISQTKHVFSDTTRFFRLRSLTHWGRDKMDAIS